MKNIPNWKTSACGAVVAVSAAIAPMLRAPWQAVAVSIGTLATSLGFMFANDARKPQASSGSKTTPGDSADAPALADNSAGE